LQIVNLDSYEGDLFSSLPSSPSLVLPFFLVWCFSFVCSLFDWLHCDCCSYYSMWACWNVYAVVFAKHTFFELAYAVKHYDPSRLHIICFLDQYHIQRGLALWVKNTPYRLELVQNIFRNHHCCMGIPRKENYLAKGEASIEFASSENNKEGSRELPVLMYVSMAEEVCWSIF